MNLFNIVTQLDGSNTCVVESTGKNICNFILNAVKSHYIRDINVS